MEGTAGSIRKVVPRVENDDSAAAALAAYGESYFATKYPLQSDPKGAPLALGLCWCPGVTLGGRVTQVSSRDRILRAGEAGEIAQTLKQSSFSLPNLRT